MTKSYKPEQRRFEDWLELLLWRLIGQPIFRLIPLPFFSFRVFVLRLYGAKIGRNNRIYPSVKIWIPRNLRLESSIGIGEDVYLYNKSMISISDNCVISRCAFLCTASHDYNSHFFELFSRPIHIAPFSWIASSAIIMPGLTVSPGSVIGAGSVLTRNTEPWSVYAGNPAVRIKARDVLSPEYQ